MPMYDFNCPTCGGFEMLAGRDDREVECMCGLTATRRPFSGLPFLKGETMPLQIPESAYRLEAQKRQHTQNWGPAERSVEMLRKNSHVDNDGETVIDAKGMANA